MEEITSKKLSSVIARILDDNKAKDIVILNVANMSVLSDYFVIASAASTPQVHSTPMFCPFMRVRKTDRG